MSYNTLWFGALKLARYQNYHYIVAVALMPSHLSL